MIHRFTEVDDLVIAAYDYVKQTGHKMQDYIFYQDKEYTELGLEAEDGTIFTISREDHNASHKRNYSRLIKQSGIEVVDFVNLQLKAFL